jgi:nucleotide-binding universal stress UspA family protein
MIAGIIQDSTTIDHITQTVSYLATALGKQAAIAILSNSNLDFESKKLAIENKLNNDILKIIIFNINNLAETNDFCETNEVSFLIIQQLKYNSKNIQKTLNVCRQLRIPYSLLAINQAITSIKNTLVPINFLEEELEKAQFASAFGRFCNAKIHLLQANDYGSKAELNTTRIQELLTKFDLQVIRTKAKTDSFKVDFEALNIANQSQTDLILITASREYGLDDLIFGPRELKLLKKSTTPLLLINPRGDLYALCD